LIVVTENCFFLYSIDTIFIVSSWKNKDPPVPVAPVKSRLNVLLS
jgi:hypothetical protein